MKRWQKVTIWIASILIVLVVGGLFAANYAVDKVLNSMVGLSVDDLIGEENINESGNGDDTVTPQSNNGEPEANETVGDPNEAVSSSNGDQSAGNSTDQPNGDGTNSSDGGSDKTSSSSNGQQSNSSNEQSSGSNGYTPEITTDKAKEVEENITLKDKAKVVSTLMGSLSASDISTLQKLASGGLSKEEKKEARDLLLEKLTEDQYNDLIGIAAKHGLSQGKSYSEVKGE